MTTERLDEWITQSLAGLTRPVDRENTMRAMLGELNQMNEALQDACTRMVEEAKPKKKVKAVAA